VKRQIYTVSQKMSRVLLPVTLPNLNPIFKILSLLENVYEICFKKHSVSHHTLIVLLQRLGKSNVRICYKLQKIQLKFVPYVITH